MGEAIAGMEVPKAVGEPTTGLPVGCTAPDKLHGVVLDGECADVFDLLFQYAAHTHNRFSVSVGSTMTPMQKIRGDRVRLQVTYPFGAAAYAKITRARRPDADAKCARGIYLGPVLGSTSHAMEIRLDSGKTKRVIAPGLKLLYPLRFDANLLPCKGPRWLPGPA